MGDFTQPQQKYAGTGENCIFFQIIKNILKIIVHIIWVCKHPDIKFRKYVKNYPKIR